MATHSSVLARESQGRRSLVGCRLWGAQSRTRLKRLSSSSGMHGAQGHFSVWENHLLFPAQLLAPRAISCEGLSLSSVSRTKPQGDEW